MFIYWGTWVAQMVEPPTLAQVMTPQFEFKPHIRLTAVSAKPASDPLSPSLCPSPVCTLS